MSKIVSATSYLACDIVTFGQTYRIANIKASNVVLTSSWISFNEDIYPGNVNETYGSGILKQVIINIDDIEAIIPYNASAAVALDSSSWVSKASVLNYLKNVA